MPIIRNRKPAIIYWEPVASTRDVKRWKRQMRAVDGLCAGLAVIFGWAYNCEQPSCIKVLL